MNLKRPSEYRPAQTGEMGQIFQVHDDRRRSTRYLRISQPPADRHRRAVLTSAPHCHRPGERAFTMIEIAIAVGVIGFAMVAIIGILPRGMGVQKENREDTMISEDAPYFIEAIRNGEMRINNNVLTNFVEWIAISNGSIGWFTNYNQSLVPNVGNNNNLSNDMAIVGYLSTPEYDARLGGSNVVMATVRAMSGSAVQQNGANAETAFRYQMVSEIDPWNFSNYSPPGYADNNTYDYANFMANNLHELRLRFAWPVLPNGSVGQGRQTYRTLVGAHLSTNYYPLCFFQPQTYLVNTNL